MLKQRTWMAEDERSAKNYDFWVNTINGPHCYHRIRNFLPPCTGLALDVGCGSGSLALFLAEHFQEVIGIDTSSQMLELAKSRQSQTPKKHVTFLAADIESFPFQQKTFDFISSAFALHHTSLALSLPALRRLIKPGGRVVLQEVVPTNLHRYKSPFRRILRTLATAPSYVQKFGFHTMCRLVSFELSFKWMRHVYHDELLETKAFQKRYRRFLPGCRFERWGEVMTVFWEAPLEATCTTESPNTIEAHARYEESQGRRQHQVEREREVPSRGKCVEFTQEDTEQSLVTRFERQVRHAPEHLALKTRERTYTYHELNAAANRLAHAIIDEREEAQEAVAVLCEHGDSPIVAALGIMKTGKYYVMLDPSSPRERLLYLLEDCGANLLVTDRANASRANSLITELSGSPIRVLKLDELKTAFGDENLGRSILPDQINCIYYTSASTGPPKGVIKTHRIQLNEVRYYTNSYAIGPEDRCSHLFSFHFGTSDMNMFYALLNGAALFPFDVKKEGGLALVSWLRQEDISFYYSVPTLFRALCSSVSSDEGFPSLRWIGLCGEPMHGKDVHLFQQLFPSSCALFNLLGSTEAGPYRHYQVPEAATWLPGASIPAGYGIMDKDILILDEDGHTLGTHEIGEVAISSAYLSPGYWNQPELNEQRFFQDPNDADKRIYLTGDLGRLNPKGCLELFGRKDLQVKIRGQRVNPGEIELVLMSLENIREAAVVAREQDGNSSLAAYFVSERHPALTVSELRRALAERLPDFMIPAHFVLLDTLPRNATGKIDRHALPEVDLNRPELDGIFTAPQSPIEKTLADFWSDILHVEQVGIRDNFFELGGDSIHVTQLIARVQSTFGTELSIDKHFLEAEPSIVNLAQVILHQIAQDNNSKSVKLLDAIEKFSKE